MVYFYCVDLKEIFFPQLLYISFLFFSTVFIFRNKLKTLQKYLVAVDGHLSINRSILNIQDSPFLNMNPNYCVSVWAIINDTEYLLCNLSKNNCHVDLDLTFGAGERVTLFCKGLGTIQLNGCYYQIPENTCDSVNSPTISVLTPCVDDADNAYALSQTLVEPTRMESDETNNSPAITVHPPCALELDCISKTEDAIAAVAESLEQLQESGEPARPARIKSDETRPVVRGGG